MNSNTATQLRPVDVADLATDTGFDQRKIDLIKSRYFIPGADDDELRLFLTVASRRGLDPTKNHIYAVERYDRKLKRYVIAYQVSIDGLRLIAERSGRYEGQTAPQWCGPDGRWRDVWLDSEPPAAARIGVYKRGFREPIWAVARWDSYVQKTKDGEVTQFWAKMPDVMLAKCAESLALRKAFPEETGGLYTTEEMAQADAPSPVDHDPAHDRGWGEDTDLHQFGDTGPGNVVVDEDTGEIIDDTDPEREQASARAHAVAGELFGRDGHTVLHIMARHAWRYDTLKQCTASQLHELANKLESKADDELAFQQWYDRWIAPYMTEDN